MIKEHFTSQLSLEKAADGYVLYVGNDGYPLEDLFKRDDEGKLSVHNFENGVDDMYRYLCDYDLDNEGFTEGEKVDMLIYLRRELARLNGFEIKDYMDTDRYYHDIPFQIACEAIGFADLPEKERAKINEADQNVFEFNRENTALRRKEMNLKKVKKTDVAGVRETVGKTRVSDPKDQKEHNIRR